ncbi:unnamed protein product, partial [Laminaria digitata]
ASTVAAALTGSGNDNSDAPPPPPPPPPPPSSSSSRPAFPTTALGVSAVGGSGMDVGRASPSSGTGGQAAAMGSASALPWAWWTEGPDGDASGSGLSSAAGLSEGVAEAAAHGGVTGVLDVGSEVPGGALSEGAGAGAGAGVDALDSSGGSGSGG